MFDSKVYKYLRDLRFREKSFERRKLFSTRSNTIKLTTFDSLMMELRSYPRTEGRNEQRSAFFYFLYFVAIDKREAIAGLPPCQTRNSIVVAFHERHFHTRASGYRVGRGLLLSTGFLFYMSDRETSHLTQELRKRRSRSTHTRGFFQLCSYQVSCP